MKGVTSPPCFYTPFKVSLSSTLYSTNHSVPAITFSGVSAFHVYCVTVGNNVSLREHPVFSPLEAKNPDALAG